VLGVALRLYQFTRPGYLFGVSQYDDGVYLGDAVRFVHGALPYRDFVSDQPPGIMILMAPVALLSKVTGTAWALAIARLLTACADGVTILLVGRLVRHRGVFAAALACAVLAVYPEAVGATYTLFLEPWLNLFCLIGAVLAFDGDRLTGGRARLVSAGAAVGFASAIKAWAVAPAVVLLALCLASGCGGGPGKHAAARLRRAAAFAAGAITGFLVPAIPFAAVSLGSFVNSVVVAQLSRVGNAPVPAWRRLQSMAGLIHIPGVGPAAAIAAAMAVAALIWLACAGAWIATRQLPPALEWFALVTTALVALMLLWPPQYFHHYASFLGPFLALAVSLPAVRAQRAGLSRWARAAGVGLAACVIAALGIGQVRAEATLPPVLNPAPAAERVIPKGACVLTDMASLTISADRFVSNVAGCPLIVDSTGTDYVLSHGRNGATGAASVAAVPALWQTAFAHTHYIWLSYNNEKWIAWTPSLRAYFRAHFRRLDTVGAPHGLYVRKSLDLTTGRPPGAHRCRDAARGPACPRAYPTA